MSTNTFFKKKGPFKLNNISKLTSESIEIFDIKPLNKAQKNHLTFYDSTKYKNLAKNTNAGACITNEKLQKHLPTECIKIISKSVLYDLAEIILKFYPDANIDYPDETLTEIKKINNDIKISKNVLIGEKVKIGKNSILGQNSIIEHNVVIGENVVIGPNVHIKNSIIGNNVVIQSGCKIGSQGFGFIPNKKKNLKFPHIGMVLIGDNVEIANNCTIDRGSVDDTVIGENSYLDNQVHVAHNVKIGKNCMIAGQVGFAGSTTIGNNVSIGGQAGVSGHLTIGDNVKIGGGSGVIKDVDANQIVMGYPAVSFKEFIKRSKNE